MKSPICLFLSLSVALLCSPTPLKAKSKHKKEIKTEVKQETVEHITTPFTVTNSIQPKNLGYYKFFSWHYPDLFEVSVNGKTLKAGEKIEVNDSSFTVTYSYRWDYLGKPYKKGARKAEFKASPTVSNYEIAFNGWDAPERIMVKNARVIKKEASID